MNSSGLSESRAGPKGMGRGASIDCLVLTSAPCPPRLVIACCLLLFASIGCEQLQRKFTRKPKTAGERPDAIIQFQDYSQAFTPLDRYQKHYTLFQYWDDALLRALSERSLNQKQLKKTSAQSLLELKALQQLLEDPAAVRLGSFIEAREHIDRQLRESRIGSARVSIVRRDLENLSREIHSGFYWRDVEESIKQKAALQRMPTSVE